MQPPSEHTYTSLAAHTLTVTRSVFEGLRKQGSKTFDQLLASGNPDSVHLKFHWSPDPESNSIALIIQHLHGNMVSRWSDFLSTDGEKTTRHRDEEFIDQNYSPEELVQRWNEGWDVLIATMQSLTAEDMLSPVVIRAEVHSVTEAILRQVAHVSQHVGQIVYLGKRFMGPNWESLSIPRGQSEAFNARMMAGK